MTDFPWAADRLNSPEEDYLSMSAPLFTKSQFQRDIFSPTTVLKKGVACKLAFWVVSAKKPI